MKVLIKMDRLRASLMGNIHYPVNIQRGNKRVNSPLSVMHCKVRTGHDKGFPATNGA